MNTFEIEILSPEGSAYKGFATSVMFPTAAGVITVLAGHTNLITRLVAGNILIETPEEKKEISVTGGFIEISENRVNVVSEFAIPSDESNKYKVEQAVNLAKEMKAKRKNMVDLSAVENELKKAVFELKSNVGLKRKKQ
ncbi:MAG: ATP synthase F1 subunit epsilon [Endomicrobia bacterium]|nr:ATP synthase F1 subunit epsilon [Endomicrobiia bacterium]MCL2506542.1 ATP synthase F1 subunit epsilon [Endomicrobiia bacterium]